MSVQQEVGDRLDAIERWVDHARKAECSPRIALGAIEALAMAGLAHCTNGRATLAPEESGPGDVVSVSPGPGPTPEQTGADVVQGTRYIESSASQP
jgi:hypothetical protein